MKHILVPLDFSKDSLRALPYAFFFSRQHNSLVTLLHAVHLNIVGEEQGVPLTRYREEMESAAEGTLRQIVSSMHLSPARVVVRIGEPVAVILQEVAEREIDLVVLAVRRRQGFGRLFHPSLARKIIDRAPCATLVTP